MRPLTALFALLIASLAVQAAWAEDDAKATLQSILEKARRRAEAPPPQEPSPAKPDPEALRKHALATNLSLRNRYWDGAESLKKQEVSTLKAERMAECRGVAQQIARLDETIKRKERERRKAERGLLDGGYGGGEGEGGGVSGIEGVSTRRRRRRPSRPNDGLEDDKKALGQAEQRKRQLQADIAAALKRIDEREATRKRNVEATYARHKRAIDAGKALPDQQMAASYKAAVDVPADPPAPAPKPARPDDAKEGPAKAPKAKAQKPAGKRERGR